MTALGEYWKVMASTEYLFCPDMESEEKILQVEKTNSKLPVGPCLHLPVLLTV